MQDERKRYDDWIEEEGGKEDAPEQYTSDTPQDLSQQSVLLEMEDEDGDDLPLGADTRLDRLSAEDNAEAVMSEIADYTEDQEILEDFAERQVMPTDEQGLMRRMREHHSESPLQTGGDVDAAWDEAEDAGDETPSTEPMPDQDRVDEIGEALGVTYEDDEELDFAAKVWRRDEERWELEIDSTASEIDHEDVLEDDDPTNDDRGVTAEERRGENEENELDEGPIDPMDFSLLEDE